MPTAFEINWTRYTRLRPTRKGYVFFSGRKHEIPTFALCLQARNLLEQGEYDVLQDSVNHMAECLNAAITTAVDDTIGDPIPLTRLEERGGPGRRRIGIDRNWLSYAIQGITLKDIGKELNCSARTVRRRLLEYRLAEPAPPVIQEVIQPDGTLTKEWHSTGPTGFDFKGQPARLDELVKGILNRFPNYGVAYVKAALRTQGYRVARDDVRESMRRVRDLQPRLATGGSTAGTSSRAPRRGRVEGGSVTRGEGSGR